MAIRVPRDRRLRANVPTGVPGDPDCGARGKYVTSLPCWEPTRASIPCKEGNCTTCPFCSQLESFLSPKCATLWSRGTHLPQEMLAVGSGLPLALQLVAIGAGAEVFLLLLTDAAVR